MAKTTKEQRDFVRRYYASSHDTKSARGLAYLLLDDLEAAEQEAEKLKNMLKYEVDDSCDTESSVKAEAKKVLPANLVDGDDCCVPDVTEIVAMLVAEVERLRKQSLFKPISELPVLVATLNDQKV